MYFKKIVLIIRIMIAGALLTFSTVSADKIKSNQIPQTYPKVDLVSPKNEKVLSEKFRAFLSQKNQTEKIKVWVYFTDKGIFQTKDYLEKVEQLKAGFPTATLKRRAINQKKETVDFYDIPVYQKYIEEIQKSGAVLHHQSRWLNAASFFIPVERIFEIEKLPFVKSVQPVKRFKKEPLPEPIIELTPRIEVLPEITAYNLNYGSSLAQLEQIGVPAVHDKGYNGSGVLVAMFDTGFRKSHTAFQAAYNEGRVLTEWDFVDNDDDTQNDPSGHGTLTWSTLGGAKSTKLYGPAFGASFILAKTEDVLSETPIEEDNWLAAVEWSDSIGAQVISSSLAYGKAYDDTTFNYSYDQLNGDFAVVTNAADMAAARGIVVCNAMGNTGSTLGSLWAPADADSILSCGAVDLAGGVAGFSSRGPTYDGRIKPEVVARGVSTFCATPTNDTSFGSASGTSLSTPLVGGCAAVLLSAHPGWTVIQVREALMQTANNADNPNNSAGWGLINLSLAIRYSFLKGDVNSDDNISVSDLIFLINYLFKNGLSPLPLSIGDVTCDNKVSPSDLVFLINLMFKNGPQPCS